MLRKEVLDQKYQLRKANIKVTLQFDVIFRLLEYLIKKKLEYYFYKNKYSIFSEIIIIKC